jgi:hypothetical protein
VGFEVVFWECYDHIQFRHFVVRRFHEDFVLQVVRTNNFFISQFRFFKPVSISHMIPMLYVFAISFTDDDQEAHSEGSSQTRRRDRDSCPGQELLQALCRGQEARESQEGCSQEGCSQEEGKSC